MKHDCEFLVLTTARPVQSARTEPPHAAPLPGSEGAALVSSPQLQRDTATGECAEVDADPLLSGAVCFYLHDFVRAR